MSQSDYLFREALKRWAKDILGKLPVHAETTPDKDPSLRLLASLSALVVEGSDERSVVISRMGSKFTEADSSVKGCGLGDGRVEGQQMVI